MASTTKDVEKREKTDGSTNENIIFMFYNFVIGYNLWIHQIIA